MALFKRKDQRGEPLRLEVKVRVQAGEFQARFNLPLDMKEGKAFRGYCREYLSSRLSSIVSPESLKALIKEAYKTFKRVELILKITREN